MYINTPNKCVLMMSFEIVYYTLNLTWYRLVVIWWLPSSDFVLILAETIHTLVTDIYWEVGCERFPWKKTKQQLRRTLCVYQSDWDTPLQLVNTQLVCFYNVYKELKHTNTTQQNRNFICKDLYIYTSSYKTFNTTLYTWHSIIINI